MLCFSTCICIVIKKNFKVKVWWELKLLFQQQDMIYRNYQTPHCRWDKQFSYKPLKDLGSCIITIQRPTPPKQSLHFLQTRNEWNFRNGNRFTPHHLIRNEKTTVEMHCRYHHNTKANSTKTELVFLCKQEMSEIFEMAIGSCLVTSSEMRKLQWKCIAEVASKIR